MAIALRSSKPAESNIRANTLSSHIAGVGAPASCIMTRDATMARIRGCVDGTQSAWPASTQHSPSGGRHVCSARISRADAPPARSDVQSSTRTSRYERGGTQTNRSRNGPPDRLDGGRVLAIPKIHGREYFADCDNRRRQEFRMRPAPRERCLVSHRPHERVGTRSFRACPLWPPAAFPCAPRRQSSRRRAHQSLSLPFRKSADRKESLRARYSESARRRRHGWHIG